jgi:hypothetical protein
MARDWDMVGNVHIAEPVFGIQVGQHVLETHGPSKCSGEACCIHNPSEHQLREAPLNWRADRYLMERICEHGVGHPDPDDLAHKQRVLGESYGKYAFGVHGCDGCCNGTYVVWETQK